MSASYVDQVSPGVPGRVRLAGVLTVTGLDSSRRSTRVPRDDLSGVCTEHVLVVIDGDPSQAKVWLAVARGRALVRRVLPEWHSPVVVEVSATAADLEEAVCAGQGS